MNIHMILEGMDQAEMYGFARGFAVGVKIGRGVGNVEGFANVRGTAEKINEMFVERNIETSPVLEEITEQTGDAEVAALTELQRLRHEVQRKIPNVPIEVFQLMDELQAVLEKAMK